MTPNKARIDYIIRSVQQGRTHMSLAEELGITRERVRQLYKKYADVPYLEIRLGRSALRKEEKLEQLRRTVKHYCRGCDRPVHVLEGERKTQSWVFCPPCREEDKVRRRSTEQYICDMCEKPYYPFASSVATGMGHNHFCSKDCYAKFRKIYRKSKWAFRIREYAGIIRELERRLRYYEVTLETGSAPVEFTYSPPKEQERKLKHKKGTCRKCTMLITGEFKQYASKIKPGFCYGCDGSTSEEETYSRTRSGVPVARRT